MTGKLISKYHVSPEEEAEIQRLIDSDPDAPEATEEELAEAKPFREVFPDLAASIDRERERRGRGRPPVESPKVPITIRLDPEIIARFQAMDKKDWRGKMQAALRNAAGL